MKNLSVLAALCAMAVAFTSPAAAQERGIRNIFISCGLGGIIFPDDELGAVVVNILTSSPTAVTQGLVAPGSCAGGAGQSAALIQATYPELAMETAVGEGVYLTALMDTLDCQPAIRQELISDMRTGLSATVQSPAYPGMDRDAKAEALFMNVHGAIGDKYAGQCNAV
ncbi:MAG: hypothetical protein AAGJ92_07155 [Pseudomonadota bacterium]